MKSCFEAVYERRERLIEELFEHAVAAAEEDGFPCDDIGPVDVFDYCFALEGGAAERWVGDRGTGFGAHAVRCPGCLRQIQLRSSS